MTVTLILFLSFFPILPILYAMLLNEAKPKKNIILGVTLPYEARQEERVTALCRRFRRCLTAVCLVLAAVPPGVFLLHSFSAGFLLLAFWLLITMALAYYVFFHFHERLRRLKLENGWGARAIQTAAVDIKAAAALQKRISGWWLVPPLVFSVIPLAVLVLSRRESSYFWPLMAGYGSNVLLTALMLLVGRIIYHQKSDVVDENTQLTLALTRVRRYNWSKCWIALSWLTGLFSLSFLLFEGRTGGLLVSSLVYSLLIFYLILRVEFVTRAAQQKLTRESGRAVFTDDDIHWPGGLFYCNPNDTHWIVNNRIGMGTTLNLGRPAGKIIAAATALLLLSLPALGGWMAVQENTPVTAEIHGEQLTVCHRSTVLKLPLDSIEQTELLDQLPKASKVAGTNFATLYKGTFEVEGLGACRLYLNPTQGPFLKLTTSEATYLINLETPTDTAALYQALSRLLRQS